MIILGVNNIDYRIYDSWSEITVKKGRELYRVSSDAPEDLLMIYRQYSKGKECDNDQVRLFTDALLKKQSDADKFYCDAIECLSDIPRSVIDKIHLEDIRICYSNYMMQFVFGALYFPLEDTEVLQEFSIMEKTYYAPKDREVMGTIRPFCDENADVFCDASDVDYASRKQEGGKYQMAELLTAIVYREKGTKYTDKIAVEVSELYKDILTCDVYHSALYKLSEVNTTLKQFSPNLYQGSNMKSKSALNQSGLADFGWLNSIMTVAEMGVLNQQGLTPIESVRQTNLYDMMSVLSNLKANNEFQRIYRENK